MQIGLGPGLAAEGMVGTFHVHHRHPWERTHVPVEEVGAAQGVPRPLEEEHRHAHPRQMVHPESLRSARRMQGVGVQHHAPGRIPVGDEHGGHAATHRPPSEDEWPAEEAAHLVGDGGMALQQHGCGIRPTPPQLGVAVVEGHHPNPAVCHGGGDAGDAAVMLVRSCSVGEEQRHLPFSPDVRRHRRAVGELDSHEDEAIPRPVCSLRRMRLVVHPDRLALAREAADLIARRASHGTMTLGLAGGSTPADTYDALGDVSIAWDQMDLWLSDERWVPHDHQDSNGRMALAHLPPAAAPRLVRPRHSSYLTPADAAVHYDAALRYMHDDRPPDIVLLGMGTDGHTASLFPDTDALAADPHRWFVENHVPSLEAWRLTATPSLLQGAETVLVLVAGEDKAQVLADAFEGPSGRYPIQLLRDARGDVAVHCDAAAASAFSA